MSSLTRSGPATEVKGLAGATVVPGLVESHGHYEELEKKACPLVERLAETA
jgi:predicted amidohydrolase YtcJ